MLLKWLISDSISSNFITTHLSILISTIKVKWNHIFYVWRNWQWADFYGSEMWNVPMPLQEGRLFAQGWSLSVHNLTVGSVFWTPLSSWCLGLGRNNCLLTTRTAMSWGECNFCILRIETKQANDPDINHEIMEISKGTCFSIRWKIINGLSPHSQPRE